MRTQLVGEASKEYCEPEMEKGGFSGRTRRNGCFGDVSYFLLDGVVVLCSVSLLHRTWVGRPRRKAPIGAVSDKTAVETARRLTWEKFPVSASLSRIPCCCRFRPGKSARTDAYRMETAPPLPTPAPVVPLQYPAPCGTVVEMPLSTKPATLAPSAVPGPTTWAVVRPNCSREFAQNCNRHFPMR